MKRIIYNLIIPLFVIGGLFYTITTLNFENWVVDRSADIENYEAKKEYKAEENGSTKREKKTFRESLRERIEESEAGKENGKENDTS